MGLFELFLVAVGLSMDAFAVSVCKGLSLGKINKKHMCIAGLWFGGFQAGMPLVGYFLGRFFSDVITEWDHWIACILLVLIGGNMVKEAFGEEEHLDCSMCAKALFPLAVATSTCSRRYFCISKSTDSSGSFVYRNHYFCLFCCRN